MSDATERWLPVPGYEGYYDVSDLGRVRSLDRVVPHGRGAVKRLRGRLLKPRFDSDGRQVVTLYGDGKRLTVRVYVLVLEAFVGPRPPGFDCCHYDGDESNDRLSNLRWDTRSANRLDSVRHGTHQGVVKTACPRGHRLVEPNLTAQSLSKGRRTCLACTRAHNRLFYAKRRGETIDFQAVSDAFYVGITGSGAAA